MSHSADKVSIEAGGALAATPPAWPRHLLAMLGLLVLTGLAYSNADHERLFFDSLQIPLDRTIADWDASLHRFWSSGLIPCQELANLSFAANYAWNTHRGLPGFDVTSFVFVNASLHVLAAWALYWFLVRLGSGYRSIEICAFLATAWFAVHPVHVASVTYIIQRRGVLTSLFYLLGLHSYLSCRLATTIRSRSLAAVGCLLCFFLSIKCKSMGLTMPLAIVLLEVCLRKGWSDQKPRFFRLALVGMASFALLAGAYLVRVDVLHFSSAFKTGIGPGSLAAPWGQFLTQMRVLAVSWGLLLAPAPGWLCFDHVFPVSTSIWQQTVVAGLALNAAILFGAVAAIRRGRALTGFGLAFFYVASVPWLLVPQAEQLVEYKLYLPAMGAACALADVLSWAATHRRLRASMALGLLLLPTLVVLTHLRNRLVKDPVVLWQDVLHKYPGHFRGWVSLGVTHSDSGQYAQALDAYRQANQIDPFNAQLHYYTANALRATGKTREAIAEYREARRIAGGDLHIAINLAATLAQLGYVEDSIKELRQGLEQMTPGTDKLMIAQAHFNLANSLAVAGRLAEAERSYRDSIENYSGYAQAHYGLGLVLDRLGRTDEALEALHTALRIRPNYPEVTKALQEALSHKQGSAP